MKNLVKTIQKIPSLFHLHRQIPISSDYKRVKFYIKYYTMLALIQIYRFSYSSSEEVYGNIRTANIKEYED